MKITKCEFNDNYVVAQSQDSQAYLIIYSADSYQGKYKNQWDHGNANFHTRTSLREAIAEKC